MRNRTSLAALLISALCIAGAGHAQSPKSVSGVVSTAPYVAAIGAQQGQPPAFSVAEFESALKDRRINKDELAEKLRAWFGAGNLANGGNAKVSDLRAAFAIEAPDAKGDVTVVDSASGTDVPLTKLSRMGKSNIYAGITSVPEGAFVRYRYVVNGQPRGDERKFEAYTAPPESRKQPGVPEGKVIQMPRWTSQVFDGATRDWWIYVPAQYTPDKPACVMVFQDGAGAKNYVPTIFDNMIQKKEIPVTIGIFLNPGTRPNGQSNRSFEYDSLSDRYTRFLLDEILPEVEKTYKLKQDAASRAIAGASSGAICAFTVAWERPDKFHKVLSWIGSYVNLQGGATGIGGGHNYPTLIRQSKTKNMVKPIRVFLQDGVNDLDNPFGHWPTANQAMAKALGWAGYDYKFVFGNGEHNGRHGQAILPDSLRWLWRDYPKSD